MPRTPCSQFSESTGDWASALQEVGVSAAIGGCEGMTDYYINFVMARVHSASEPNLASSYA